MTALVTGGCTVDAPPAPQSTDTTQTSTPPLPKATQIIMGIDNIGPGFNPHLLSDQSPVNAAISALVLPSAFRPVADTRSPTGSRWDIDSTLLLSAAVTSQNPFTVTYKFKPEASWTDNAPITADDFWYLWRQMVSQPGVVDPAGYDLITGVQSIDGGKTAVVTFSQPYPAWRELFTDILPAHIVKDVPGGFGAGLARTMPVTGGIFRVESIDPQRDEILLARNDRFWGQPAQPDQILFRRAGSPAALADSIRNGDTQVAQVHGSGVAFAQLSAIPQVRTGRVDTPRVLQLSLRAEQPALTDPQVRRALLGLLDVELLASVGSGSDSTVTLAQAQVRSPSDPGYQPTAPPPLTQQAALALLRGRRVRDRHRCHPGPDAGAAPVTGNGRHGRAAPHRTHPRAHQQGRPTTRPGDRGGCQRSGRRCGGQHRGRSTAQRRHRRDGVGAGSRRAVRRCAGEQPGGRDRGLAPRRGRPCDGTGVSIRLPGTGGHTGVDVGIPGETATDHRAGSRSGAHARADDSRGDHAGHLGAAGAPLRSRCAGTGAVQYHRCVRPQRSAQYRCRP